MRTEITMFSISPETSMRIGYGLTILILFTFATLAGAPYMAVFASFIALGWILETWSFISNELQNSLKLYINSENVSKGSKPISSKSISTLVKTVKVEFIILHFICSFYHVSRTIHLFYPKIVTSLYSEWTLGSGMLHYGVLIYPLKFFHFFTCMFYMVYLSFTIRNILQSSGRDGINDVIISHHVLAIGAQHLVAFLTTIFAVTIISFPYVFGTFWTFLVLTGVALNDACAYFIGRYFGKHPLSKLSPKKTLEGYLGACLLTVATALVFTIMVLNYQENNDSWMNLSTAFPADDGISFGKLDQSKILMHAFVISTFISTLSPLIGLYFSAIKRSFKKKDFGSSLGPHGGFIDRFECTSISAVFAYLYLGFIFEMQ